MYSYIVVDVFTDTPLEGNPVAVFPEAAGIPASRMQRIAREMNLSETAFVLPARNGADARVRIFTPVNELPFAGHPILGTAIALAESTQRNEMVLETTMGAVPFQLHRADGQVRAARMRQPIPTWRRYERADELLAALGLTASSLPVEIYHNGPRHVYIGLSSVAALSRVRPDLRALATHDDLAVNCFAPAAPEALGESDSRTHWRMRMFSPAYGVAEDAATGSAAGPLAVHLARYGAIRFGQQIEILQGVEMGRPSLMLAVAAGTAERVERVEVAGSAVVVARGTLFVQPTQ